MKYSLCIETVFNEIPFYDRIKLAKDLGFDAIEFYNPADYDPKKIAGIIGNEGIDVAICGVWNGYPNRLNSPYDLLEKNINATIDFGKEIGCNTFTGHVQRADSDLQKERQTLVDNLKKVAEICEKRDATIAIEILNSKYEEPGYLLDTTAKAIHVIDEVGSRKIRILNDIYHTQIMEGNLIRTITENIDYMAHFHGASIPERNEMFHGEVNYKNIVDAIDKTSYEGFLGFEYTPSYAHKESLKDVLDYLRA